MALRDRGILVSTVANRPPQPEDLPEDVAYLMDDTLYIFPLNLKKLLVMFYAQIFFALLYPRRYWQAWQILLSENSSQGRIWLRNFMHFAGGTYLAWQLRHEGLSQVHAHFSTNAASLACFVAVLLNIDFSITIHNEIFVERLLLPAKLHHAKFIVFISDYSRRSILQEFPEIEGKSHIVHCGILPQSIHIERHSIPTILSAAQLVQRKGMDYLLKSCQILNQRGFHFHCIIAGDGEERPKLEAMASENVVFLGRYQQKDLAEIFAKADIFVLACVTSENGDRDGIPVVLMEAMAAGLPVISSSVSGIPELISDDVDGLLLAEKDAEALADAIMRLFSDDVLYERLRAAAKAKIASEFSIETSSRELAVLFGGKREDRQ